MAGSNHLLLTCWSPAMAPRVVPVAVLRPRFVKRGCYFLKCRRYTTAESISYNYILVGAEGRERRPSRSGHRQLLSFKFPLSKGGWRRLDLHRVFAMNSAQCNPKGLNWSSGAEVHHKPRPRRQPWTNCCAENLMVMTKSQHKAWHRSRADVARR